MALGFGSLQDKKQMKSCVKDLLAKHFQLCIVDEFRTSKVCSFCLEGETCYYKKKENPRPFREGMVNVESGSKLRLGPK